jgi:methylated-DNA-protein-cysteine methyltransferase-like protein
MSPRPISPFNQVYEIVARIPKGRVLTYGAISKKMGGRLSAAAVGWAMRALPQDATKTKDGGQFHSKSVPWHRVINSRGGISTNNELDIPTGLQQTLLEAEGVVFDASGTIDLAKYLWPL